MVTRTNRTSGSAFLGCSRFPACRGTRPLAAVGTARHVRQRHQLWGGSRPRSAADAVELIAARVVGHTLHAWQAVGLRIVLVVIVFVAFTNLVGPVSTWLGQSMADAFRHSMTSPASSATPSR
jgi:hypothetical protein